MLPVKHTVIYTFFAITSVQNTCFCSVFNALASKNPAKSCYVQCFFHFWPFFHCRKATKMTQNSISIPSCAQTPKNPRKMSKTPPNSGLGAKPFLGPPAKADIATAILTNVIEHLVLLLPPNKHAFTAKVVWADSLLWQQTKMLIANQHSSTPAPFQWPDMTRFFPTQLGLRSQLGGTIQWLVGGAPFLIHQGSCIQGLTWKFERCGMYDAHYIEFVSQCYKNPNPCNV